MLSRLGFSVAPLKLRIGLAKRFSDFFGTRIIDDDVNKLSYESKLCFITSDDSRVGPSWGGGLATAGTPTTGILRLRPLARGATSESGWTGPRTRELSSPRCSGVAWSGTCAGTSAAGSAISWSGCCWAWSLSWKSGSSAWTGSGTWFWSEAAAISSWPVSPI